MIHRKFASLEKVRAGIGAEATDYSTGTLYTTLAVAIGGMLFIGAAVYFASGVL